MRDLFGKEIEQWIAVEREIHQLFSHFGYTEIRTPVLENIGVFTHTVGEETDIVEKQMYTVPTGDETLVLRPEGTAPFIRAVVEHELHQSGRAQRFYYYLPMFRHERPQKGRSRQFHQFGAELICDTSPEADAEIITLIDHLYRGFEIQEYEIKVNSVGCGVCRPKYRDTLKEFLKPHLGALCEECQKRFERSALRILDCKKENCQKITQGAPFLLSRLCGECSTHHRGLKERLREIGIGFVEDPRIVRGLDYYCRTAFEFVSGLLGAQSALAAGGRYDGMAERFGAKPFPGTGFAMGMERLMVALEAKNKLFKNQKTPFCFFAALGEAAFKQLFPLSLNLKRKGVWVEISYEKEKSLKAQLKQANRSGARVTLILGENELETSEVLLKDMSSGAQETLALADLEGELLRRSQIAS